MRATKSVAQEYHSEILRRLLRPIRGDMEHGRKLWCPRCKVWTDRDVNTAVVLSMRGLARLASSLPRQAHDSSAGEKGLAVEAMRGNQTTPAILLVDASKGSINWNSARPVITH